MKTTGTRSFILYILCAGFAAGLCVFLYGLFVNGGNWAVQPFNKHISGGSSVSAEGRVLDRSGVVLAESENGKRVYSNDETVRRAMLHAVGDTQGYISTGVQYNFRAELSGYNFVTGLASPTGQSSGNDLRLTLDSGLCSLARQQLGSRNGAAALYNYKTGEMLCMVSTPDYDPANPPKDLTTDQTGKYDGVFVNKVLSSSLTPGSIFKLVTSAAAIEQIKDLDSRTWNCNGSVTINGNKITDMRAYGKLDFKNALAKSSNVAFSQIAIELGADTMTAMANEMGFNRTFALEGIPSAKSVYNVNGAQPQELGWSGVGQFTDLANPYHMMILMGAIANGGTYVQPYLVQNVSNSFGFRTVTGSAKTGGQLLSPETAAKLTTYMRYDVTSDYGDGLFPGMKVSAKTGTGEIGSGKKPNCWMVGFSSDEKTPFAFAVLVENQNSSIASAGKLASALMRAAAKIS
ncbi:Penicillin binding protein transpeptidase domain protein [Caprobacter fermentans]|uniref:Penicillin binding protein transpeptidase domain protein n=1 Tax=Caproicibacter fermentans TaxID=2576756 RepID=A0A6N8HWA4_9FIRM|nr:penicillin-binding transpeptidase domain-containing protein [Caproicibacter fermentans]MVB10076.1 Penicillin binding protein transpeptidase domain protein [Caproicibacter fermentans]OCN03345.1 penicillin-binding protein [Clostridium sp. W14A]